MKGPVWGHKQWGTQQETKCTYLEVVFYSAPVLVRGGEEEEVRGNTSLICLV